jgi:hypothetical protein
MKEGNEGNRRMEMKDTEGGKGRERKETKGSMKGGKEE